MYKICSWDVGIKNLAYCILVREADSNSGKDKFRIEKWDIINLIEEKTHTCPMLLKNKQVCNAHAQYTALDYDGVEKYYCGKHKNLHVDASDAHTDSVVQLDKTIKASCTHTNAKTNKVCGKKAIFDINKTTLCKAHAKQTLDKKIKGSHLKKIKKEKCTFADSKHLAKTMYDKLNKIPELLNVNEVLIENQPSLKNPVMKTVSCLLFGYFIMKCTIDKGDDAINVRFMSPSNKLKITDSGALEIIKRTGENKKYKVTKELSVKYSKILLKDNTTWLEHLDKYKKKDDLCDSFLQGYYYLFKATCLHQPF